MLTFLIITDNMSYMTKKIYTAQDKILETIFQRVAPLIKGCETILGGGTALARFYLHHRISYDLDFFLSCTFDPIVLSRRLETSGLSIHVTGIESGGGLAAQLHGTISVPDEEELHISFVEDVFAGMFDTVTCQGVRTEVIDGLYHRKLRTVSGTGITLSLAGHELGHGHRQTARDLYDLFVLDTETEPIEKFILRINEHGAGFPIDIFRQNMAAISWLDLIDECEMLEVLPPFEKVSAMELKRYFDHVMGRMMQCGM
jgi:hypothetical protein